jgi:hypothetical protein
MRKHKTSKKKTAYVHQDRCGKARPVPLAITDGKYRTEFRAKSLQKNEVTNPERSGKIAWAGGGIFTIFFRGCITFQQMFE